MGSKAKHAKAILQAIGELESIWVEPFVGGANMIAAVPNSIQRIGNDINVHVIAMFQALQNGWIPPEFISEDQYQELKAKQDVPNPLVGFVGVGCSYSGKWFGGYARGAGRNYCRESAKNLLKQKEHLLGVQFLSKNYLDLDIPKNAIVYCDPPYCGATKYNQQFDTAEFWSWCDKLSNRVYVSEYTSPSNWRCIWEKVVPSSLTKDTGSKRAVERLFTKGNSHARDFSRKIDPSGNFE